MLAPAPTTRDHTQRPRQRSSGDAPVYRRTALVAKARCTGSCTWFRTTTAAAAMRIAATQASRNAFIMASTTGPES